MATNGSVAEQAPPAPASTTSSAPAHDAVNAADNTTNDKDHIAWLFVEQYYNTLSKTPEKLHLFYDTLRSQFVYGNEDESASVAVGRKAIKERISQLDLLDCKLRITNVDAQTTNGMILVQTIGESSNKGADPKKFVQTFVLASQTLAGQTTSGYYILNDILRYIAEEGPEEYNPPEDAAAPVDMTPAVGTESEKAPAVESESTSLDATAVEQKLVAEVPDKGVANAEGEAVEAPIETKASEPEVEQPGVADAEVAARQVEEEDVKESEKPQEPSPSPVVKPVTQEPEPTPTEPAAPPKPMTWASRLAANAKPRPVVPLAKAGTPPAGAQARAPPPAAAPAAAPATAQTNATPASASAPAEPASKETAGWQTAGADSKRQNRPQPVAAAPAEKEGTMGYIKNVTEKITESELKTTLAAYGEVTYLDINRSKNCAFVEFKTPEVFQAATAANPHTVNGETIIVEPRRPKSTAYGGSNYGPPRGGASGRGRGNYDGNRGGGPGSRGGNFSGQNRGRGAPRGRGNAPVTSA
ncbi:hypothetical protein S7711_07217 [Stachybotrys chartarum IBT 7711]|uniref:NTF2 domain-containing protein n=1 Tax=Stachybotrys chartarum (strain CBS 109288 / IBT 7711) TaxID=1280523 RepID=A0A084AKK7_STACB|nr:hypothetical protein S7711_07217 [Stachybotrys chartarum IBT 7711]KFA55770.1 hypothetical protein S40293_01948 [Stachybotrys chartarum IBT 40293]KFA79529.1 hypothetical protein S40288_01107 [Stachybotrys chartarum IBT 40288]